MTFNGAPKGCDSGCIKKFHNYADLYKALAVIVYGVVSSLSFLMYLESLVAAVGKLLIVVCNCVIVA
uniref:Uncharacterized protein n=1 Tax=virus sp. ctBM815 TaxID=2825806 RepID=A0A8S5RK82_9VIRU|nr:MAG TPA: hypothetical protein [virus sp. ctBM815]